MFSLEKGIITALLGLFRDTGTTKLFQNAKFDLSFLKIAGIDVEGPVFDTMLAEQLILSGLGNSPVNLAALSKKYLQKPLPKQQQKSDWSGGLSKEQLEYAASDVQYCGMPSLCLKPLRKLSEADRLSSRHCPRWWN